MDPKDLINQIKKGESDTIEFKESFNEDAIQTLGAFAHHRRLLNHQPSFVLVNNPYLFYYA